MNDFKGKYQDAIEKAINAAYPSHLDELDEMNAKIGDCFETIKAFFHQRTPDITILGYLKTLRTKMESKEAGSLKYLEELIDKFKKVDQLDMAAIIAAVREASHLSLKMAMVLKHQTESELKDAAFSLHKRKNEAYNDGWYYMGSYGVFLDLHRKVFRLNSIIRHKRKSQVEDEDLADTAIDTFNYTSLLSVAMTEIDQFI